MFMDDASITQHFVLDHEKHSELIKKYRGALKTSDPSTIDHLNNLFGAFCGSITFRARGTTSISAGVEPRGSAST